MHSSIFSSDWRKTLALAFVLFAGTLGTYEVLWRVQGFKPSLSDSSLLWSSVRRDVKPDSFVLLGTSRMQVGFVPAVFRNRTGINCFNLSIDAANPIPVLKSFAEDRKFHGTIICELNEAYIASDMWVSVAKEYLQKYKVETLSERMEQTLKSEIQRNAVFCLPDVYPWRILSSGFPSLPYITLQEDRSRQAHYEQIDPAKLRRKQAVIESGSYKKVTQNDFLARAKEVEKSVGEIQNTGGQVVFIRFPTSGKLAQMEERVYPKSEYWDVFARRTSAFTINYRDEEESANLTCPDSAHLDYSDAVRFTNMIAKKAVNHWQ